MVICPEQAFKKSQSKQTHSFADMTLSSNAENVIFSVVYNWKR